jgi:3-isopropylmalate/(R)-2-methylmalate dehydratase small subunit
VSWSAQHDQEHELEHGHKIEPPEPAERERDRPLHQLASDVGNHNFGYGHPHYPPMKAMRHMGIAGVIAESFSPGYWRGEISMGFPQVSCPGILAFVERWDEIEVDWSAQQIKNLTQGTTISFEPLSKGDLDMLEAGGLETYLKKRFQTDTAMRSSDHA